MINDAIWPSKSWRDDVHRAHARSTVGWMGPPVEPMSAIFPRDPNEIARGISPSVVLTRAVAVTVPAAGLVS